MKKTFTIYILFAALVLLSLTQCKKSEGTQLELIEISKLESIDVVRAQPVGFSKPTKVSKTGKIYLYKNFLFVNERHKGIHIFENSRPNNPVNLGFIKAPGNVDIAIIDDILYADSYVDLLAFNIAAINDVKQVKRVKDVFKQFYTYQQKYIYTYKDTLINREKYYNDMMFANASYSNSTSTGVGGSMARFTLLNNYLYTVGTNELSLFDVSNVTNPTFVKSINLGWGVETIFPYDNKLFIGTNTGMHIFNATDAANPVKLSTYSHVFACDPVVVQGKYAFVTLRTGNMCRQATNQLEVVDIEDPSNPKQVAVFPMQNPHGLTISGNNLFVCEGAFGLKSFSNSDKTKIGNQALQKLSNVKSYDVIAGPKSLIVTGEDGVYQFNYDNPARLVQLSKIKIQAPTYSPSLNY